MSFSYCSFLLALTLACQSTAASLDGEAVGRDLTGWSDGSARYSVDGVPFGADRPVTETDAAGNLVVRLDVRERRGGSVVFVGTIVVTVSPDGTIQRGKVKGVVDGREFETADVTRPEPVVEVIAAAGEEGVEAAEAPPQASPDERMIADLLERLATAIDSARASERVVKRDLSSWIFTRSASPAPVLVSGVRPALVALFRHAR